MRFLAFICVCAIGIGCTREDRPPAPAAPAPASPPQRSSAPERQKLEPPHGSTPGATSGGAPRIAERRETYTTREGLCAVELASPELAGPSSPEVLAKVQQLLSQAVLSMLPEDCRGTRDPSPVRPGERCADLPPAGKTDVLVEYSVGRVTPGLLSLRLHRTACTNPSLHPEERVEGLTVNLQSGAAYTLAELFRPETPWRSVLEQAVHEKLASIAPDVPDTEISIDRFFLKDGALVVLEPVSIQALHALDVEVPLTRLQPMLRGDVFARDAEK